jgi:hypothetical protein
MDNPICQQARWKKLKHQMKLLSWIPLLLLALACSGHAGRQRGWEG